MADKSNEQTVAQHLFSLLDESAKTDKELEMALKLKPKTVSNWRRGRSHGYMRYLPEIAAFFGVTLLMRFMCTLPDSAECEPFE